MSKGRVRLKDYLRFREVQNLPEEQRKLQIRGCVRKTFYPGQAEALAGMAWQMKQPDAPTGLGAYKCPFCDGWHVGHDRRLRGISPRRPDNERKKS